jgi:hypothetical protein
MEAGRSLLARPGIDRRREDIAEELPHGLVQTRLPGNLCHRAKMSCFSPYETLWPNPGTDVSCISLPPPLRWTEPARSWESLYQAEGVPVVTCGLPSCSGGQQPYATRVGAARCEPR